MDYLEFLNHVAIELESREWNYGDLAEKAGVSEEDIKTLFCQTTMGDSSDLVKAIKKILGLSKIPTNKNHEVKELPINDYLRPAKNIKVGDTVFLKLKIDYIDSNGLCILSDEDGVYNCRFDRKSLLYPLEK